MPDLKFKRLTVENWLDSDPTVAIFAGRLLPDGTNQPYSGDDWLRDILVPSLSEKVPLEVVELYEVARGALVYGYFFYPLYTLGFEQLFRVAEAAIVHKCAAMSAPTSRKHFVQRIDWLASQGVLSAEATRHWHSARELRNYASHPQRQTLTVPGEAIGALQRMANDINALFS